ncbi:MAG: sulfatase-like hydrolase/transferase [Rhodobacteraceae bacterium]|nr:sulfatase-like hydrolase/transferase [Paracoccaceae bacterium]
MTRPNILLIMTDQHRADHLGCYGNPVLRTPHIDSLARGGLKHEAMFVNCPICMPNRIAMMTMRMPSANGARQNGIPMDRDAVSYVDLLRAAGYRTALVGKSHLQAMTDRAVPPESAPADPALSPPPAGLDEAWRSRRAGPDYGAELIPAWIADPERTVALPHYGFDEVHFANGHGDQVHGHYDAWVRDRGGDLSALAGRKNAIPDAAVTAPQAWRTSVPETLYPTSYIAEETCAFLERAAGQQQPFFLQCSFPDPHHPFTPPGRYFDLYDPSQIPLPPSFARRDQGEHPLAVLLREREARGASHNQAAAPFAVSDPAVARQIIALTYGMIAMVDDAVGRILATLDRLDLRRETVVIFTADHGDFMGDHGLMLKHGLHGEGVLRVPFLWSDPEGPPARVAEIGCSIDLGPTILARAGLAPFHGAQGLDLFAAAPAPRAGILVEEDELPDHLAAPYGMRTRSFVTPEYRLTLYEGWEGGELFDRRADPHELVNLWDDPSRSATRARLTEAMLRETIRLGDRARRSAVIA